MFFPRAQHTRIYNLVTIYCCEFRGDCEKQVIQTIIVRTAANNIFLYLHLHVANKMKPKSLDCAQEAGKNTRIAAHDFTDTSPFALIVAEQSTVRPFLLVKHC